MTNFIIKKQGQGNYKVYVIVNYAMEGEFNTTNSTLIDDLQDWKDGSTEFMNFDTRAELEFHVREFAGIVSTTIGGVDFSESINKLFDI
jgi:hypothetical protein